MALYDEDVQQQDGGPGPGAQADVDDWAAAANEFLQREGRPPAHNEAVTSRTTGRTYAGMPGGYHVADGRVQRMGWWDEWGRGATIGMGAGLAGAYGGSLLNEAMAGSGAGAFPPLGSTPPGVIPTGASAAGAFPPLGGIPPGVIPTAANAAAGGVNWEQLMRGGLAGAAGIGSVLNRPPKPPDMSPELRAMYEAQRRRMESQNPLYESVAQLAFHRLPTSATAGLSAPSFAEAESRVPPLAPGEDYREARELRELLRQQQVRGAVGDPVFDAITRLAGQRMPTRRG